jgi:hypothetical protein
MSAQKDRRTFMDKVLLRKARESFLDDVDSQHQELFHMLSYYEVLKTVISKSFWITLGALIEVSTESIVAFAMIRGSNTHDAF